MGKRFDRISNKSRSLVCTTSSMWDGTIKQTDKRRKWSATQQREKQMSQEEERISFESPKCEKSWTKSARQLAPKRRLAIEAPGCVRVFISTKDYAGHTRACTARRRTQPSHDQKKVLAPKLRVAVNTKKKRLRVLTKIDQLLLQKTTGAQ